jgi:GNAT superfamily N-acetyltransferase
VIRPYESTDAAAVSAIFHEEEVPHPVTPAGVQHWRVAQPERARARSWVAEEDGRVLGLGESSLRWTTSAEGVGEVWVYVTPAARSRGLGGALYAETERHARNVGARVLESWSYTDAGNALLEARGFRVSATERISLLEPAEADTSGFEELKAEKAEEGFTLVPLQAVLDRPAELHRVYAAAAADIPERYREDDVRLEEWRRETLEHPQLSGEASFVIVKERKPVALAFVELDEPAGLAANELTGTLPEFRRRGLARLAKLATIRWVAEHGITAMLTGNAEVNAGMIQLNESLGYRPLLTETQFIRDDLS